MLDLDTLESLTDRQILFKLIGLITSLITVQHRDRSPSSTPCRNGSACSFVPRCWFSHAPHTVPPPTKSPVLSQRSAPIWRTPRPCHASATPSPPCFSSRNAFEPLAPRRRRRRSPVLRRAPAANRPDETTPSSTPCTTSSELSLSPPRRRRRHQRRRRRTKAPRSAAISTHHEDNAVNHDDTSSFDAATPQRLLRARVVRIPRTPVAGYGPRGRGSLERNVGHVSIPRCRLISSSAS